MELAIGSIMKEIFSSYSSYSNTFPFNYLFGDKELLARQVGPRLFPLQTKKEHLYAVVGFLSYILSWPLPVNQAMVMQTCTNSQKTRIPPVVLSF